MILKRIKINSGNVGETNCYIVQCEETKEAMVIDPGADVDKIIETATNQINEINLIKEKQLFDLLSEKDKIAADYRIKYPESSLQELAEIISIETNSTLTKSGLHHRFNRIKSLANKIKNNE